MRGSSTFDGKMTGNRQLVDRYNESKGKKKRDSLKGALHGGPGTQPGSLPKAGGGESGGAREVGGHDEIKNLVDEHGPGTSHTIMRSPQGYHSITHHEDGHVSHADHNSYEEAADHQEQALGATDTEHFGDMDKDDYRVAKEDEGAEMPSRAGTTRVGYMG